MEGILIVATQLDDSIYDPMDAYPEADFLRRLDAPTEDKPFALIREALFFNEAAYRVLRNHASPMGRGAFILLVIVILVALAQVLGLALGLLTSPRIDILQNAIYDAIANTGLYANRAASVPEFAFQFRRAYEGVWQIARLFTGYPTWSTTVVTSIAVVAGGFLNWLIYGLLAHGTARWFGGRTSFTRFMGPLALAYAPLMLSIILLFPGAAVATPLVFLALLVAKYQAVKVTYGLDPGRSLAATLIPFLLATLILLAIALFGAAYGLGRIPYLEPLVRMLQLVTSF